MPTLITSCVILGAKCEQPMTPSINRMIKLLNEDERQVVTKLLVIAMEAKILTTLGFDLNFLSPLIFLEIYLRLLDL